MPVLINYPLFHADDDNGTPLTGGLLYGYIAGTSTPKATYTTRALAVANTNPVVLNSRGEAVIYGSGLYKLVLKTSAGVTIWTQDNVDLGGSGDGFSFSVDASESNQSVAGSGSSLYDILTALGTSKKATVHFQHNGTSDTTTYTFSTSFNASSYSNVSFNFDNGAIMAVSSGATITIPSPANIIAAPDQQIFSGSGTVAFYTGGIVYPNYWTENVTPGTTDMTAAIQAAVTSTEDKGGKVVLLGELYAISSDINITHPLTIEGTGWDSIIFQTADTMAIHAEDLTSEQVGLTLREFQIDMDNHGQYDAGTIQINNFAGFLVDHVYLKDGNRASGASGVSGIAVSQSSGTSGPKGTIRDCLIENFAKNGIYINPGSTAAGLCPVHITNNIIRNCSGVSAAANGIAISGSNVTATGNWIYNNDGTGILVQPIDVGSSVGSVASGVVIQGNVIRHNGQGGSVGSCIKFANAYTQPEQWSVISGNYCYQDDTGHGIHIENTTGVILQGNICRNNDLFGIYIDGSSMITCSGNQCVNNGQGHSADGIGLRNSSILQVYGNICTDDQVAGTQVYGLSYNSGGSGITGLVQYGNYLVGNTIPLSIGVAPTQSNVFGDTITTGQMDEGYLARDFATYSVTGTVTETNMATCTIPRYSYLQYKGLKVRASGIVTDAAMGNKTVKLYLGSTSFTVLPGENVNTDWIVDAEILFSSSTSQRIHWIAMRGAGSGGASTVYSNYESGAEDLGAGNLTLKLTGKLNNANDTISQLTFTVMAF